MRTTAPRDLLRTASAEYAPNPALVAEYETRLPNKALLQAKLDEFYALAKREGEEG